jgi:hypothetical protein
MPISTAARTVTIRELTVDGKTMTRRQFEQMPGISPEEANAKEFNAWGKVLIKGRWFALLEIDGGLYTVVQYRRQIMPPDFPYVTEATLIKYERDTFFESLNQLYLR